MTINYIIDEVEKNDDLKKITIEETKVVSETVTLFDLKQQRDRLVKHIAEFQIELNEINKKISTLTTEVEKVTIVEPIDIIKK